MHVVYNLLYWKLVFCNMYVVVVVELCLPTGVGHEKKTGHDGAERV